MSTLKQLKDFFRTRIKVVPGGPPIGTPSANRSQGVLDALDKLAEELKAISTDGRTLSAVTLNVDAQVGNKYQLSPDLVTLLTALIAAGKKPVWIIPDAGSAARTTIYAKNFNVLPANTAAANAAGVDAMRTNLLGQ